MKFFSIRTAAALALSAVVLVSVVSPVVLAASLSQSNDVAMAAAEAMISEGSDRTIGRRNNNNGGGNNNKKHCMWQGQSYQHGV